MSPPPDRTPPKVLPLPRTPLLLALATCLLLTAPTAVGSVVVPEAIHGKAYASAFTKLSGYTEMVQGGLYQYQFTCFDCIINVTFTTGGVVVLKNGQPDDLEAGTYEIREFYGTYGYTRNALKNFTFMIEGEGRVFRI